MSHLTTHILDTSQGRPAQGVTVLLFEQQAESWQQIAQGVTNQDGRIPDLLSADKVLSPGIYKLKFLTRPYFGATASFYPFIEICFEISGPEHYHVPLLLNPFGYSTYRGS